MKRTYIKPILVAAELQAAQVLAESGGTSGHSAATGKNDVVFENRKQGWNSEDWTQE